VLHGSRYEQIKSETVFPGPLRDARGQCLFLAADSNGIRSSREIRTNHVCAKRAKFSTELGSFAVHTVAAVKTSIYERKETDATRIIV